MSEGSPPPMYDAFEDLADAFRKHVAPKKLAY